MTHVQEDPVIQSRIRTIRTYLEKLETLTPGGVPQVGRDLHVVEVILSGLVQRHLDRKAAP